jgi:hypothetical protein
MVTARIGAAFLAVAMITSLFAGCATTPPGEGRGAEICRAALTDVAGYLEAKKRVKGGKARYARSLKSIPKDANIPPQVNGYPLEYTRTRKGFILECRYGKPDDVTSCTMNHVGKWECRRVVGGG